MSQDNDKNELSILSSWWFNIDKQLLICFLILTFFGLTISFTIKPGGSYVSQVSIVNAFTNQSIYLLFGVIIFLTCSFFQLKTIKKYVPYIIVILLVMLIILTLETNFLA